MKKIVLFSDGTGNSASSPHKTNVWRAYQALDRSDGSNQIAYYDNGVGTSPFTPTAILGLALGWGLARNVRQIYAFLCRTYEDGDEIYGFGFSRGAFTIRVVIALIAHQGIVDRAKAKDDRDLDRLVAAAYNQFRSESFTPSLLSFFLRPIRDCILSGWYRLLGYESYQREKNIGYQDTDDVDCKGTDDVDCLIKFIGVWDTVDAYGLPIDELTRAWDKVVWPLTAKDRDLSRRIERACHALALDERRESFEPMLWNEKGVEPATRVEDERLSQIWFSGVHANVGGGYPDDSLAFISLDWMMGESERNEGLVYIPEERQRIKTQANLNGPVYDNRSGVGNLYRYAPRNIERLCHEKKPGLANWLKEKLKMSGAFSNEVDIEKPKFHHSVFDRLTQGGDSYAPINIPRDYVYVDPEGNLIDIKEKGVPETADQANDRRTHQSYVWNKVWGRKLLYFATLVSILCFIGYPYWAKYNDTAPQWFLEKKLMPLFGSFSSIIQQIPALLGKIPGLGFAESWAESYQRFPFVFSIGILVIGGLLLWSLAVRAAIRSEMRMYWFHVVQPGARPTSKVNELRKKLAEFLEGPMYTDKIARFFRIGLESLTILLLVALVLAGISRLFFTVVDSAGGICKKGDDIKALGVEFNFNPKDACFDTGIELKEGVTYEIKLRVFDSKNKTNDADWEKCTIEDNWKDDTIDADVKGWCKGWCETSPPWFMTLFTPVRRHMLAEWYQPIARIDNKLLDRYPLALNKPSPTTQQTVLQTRLTARRSGRLYLYLNDAVFFTPSVIKEFYDNNSGKAKVTVTRIVGGLKK